MNEFTERVRFERYRMIGISTWPDGPAKRAALAAAAAALDRELAYAQSRHAKR